MRLSQEAIKSITKWLEEKSESYDYGSLTLEIKLSGDRDPYIKGSVHEQVLFHKEEKRAAEAS